MYTLTRVIVFLLFTLVVKAQEQDATIILQIENISSDEGQMLIGLYDSKDNWLQKPVKGLVGKIEKGQSSVEFLDIPDGTYAISVFHDEDSDGKLDSFLGIPTEATGSSNDAPSRFGPPTWKDAKFEVAGGTVTQIIHM